MATVGEAIISRLLADGSITALTSTRILPVYAGQDTAAPFIVIVKVDTNPVNINDGSVGLSLSRYQIDSWAKTLSTAHAIAALIRTSLDGLIASILGVSIQGVLFDDEREDFDSDAALFRVGQDYRIWHDI